MSIRRGTQAVTRVFRGTRAVQRVYRGRRLVWEKGTETGTGTVTYVWDESTRSVAVQQTSATGNASFSFDAGTQGLTVTGGAEPYD